MLMAVLLYLDRFCVSFAADYIREDLDLTQNEVSWFFLAFFFSYALAQVPSGWLSDRHGARAMLVIYILSWSFFTGMIGVANSLWILVLMRLGCGLGQAGAYPTSASLISKWVPFSNRGTASSIVAFGGRCGGVIAPLLTAYLIVFFMPMEVPAELKERDILNGPRLSAKLSPAKAAPLGLFPDLKSEDGETESDELQAKLTEPSAAGRRVWSLLTGDVKPMIARTAAQFRALESKRLKLEKEREEELASLEMNEQDLAQLVSALNGLIARAGLYRDQDFKETNLTRQAIKLLGRMGDGGTLSEAEQLRFNRLLLEGTFRQEIGKLYVLGWPGMVPWKRLLKSRSLWFLCLSAVGSNISWVFLVTWLPRYLIEVHDVPILQRGLMASIPLTVGVVGMLLGGRLTDLLVPIIGLRWGRRLPKMVAGFTSALG